jgi:hypothetical protein
LAGRQALRNSAGLFCGCHVTTTGDEEVVGAADAALSEASLPLPSQPARHATKATRPVAAYQDDFFTVSPRVFLFRTALSGRPNASSVTVL